MAPPIPHWKKVDDALQASREACARLTQATKQKKSRPYLDLLRKEWGKLYDEYARLRDGPRHELNAEER